MATESFTANQNRTKSLKIITLKSRWTIFEDHLRLWMIGFLIVADVFSLSAAIFVASQIRQLPGIIIDPSYIEIFSLLAITLVIMFARNGLYPGVGLNAIDELRRIVSSTSFTFLVMLGITFALKTTHYYSRLILIITWLLGLAFIPVSRYMMRRLLIRLKLWGEPVVIIGDSKKILPLAEHFRENLQLGLRPVAVLRNDQCDGCALSVHTSDSICTIKAQARDLSLKTALVVIDDLNDIDQLVERFRTIFHRVILIKDKNGRYGLNGLEFLDFSNVMGLQVKNNLLNPWSQVLKRLIDVLAIFLGCVFLAPTLGLIALWIRIDSPGGVFYRQVRLGRNGQAFNLLKFRTMHEHADQILIDQLAHNPTLKKEWDSYQKLKNDPRITRVGKFLRKFSLDELPQLWNIARAEMSLVGPRPMLPDQRDLYGEAFGNYIQVAPGITGLWQVSGRNQTTFTRRAELDDEYIQCWSVWLDIYILFKTIKVVFWQKGAY
jgi:Undecaprenyl-phosphate galactose phosphotransferase WbaP